MISKDIQDLLLHSLDNELKPEERARLEAALAASPKLREEQRKYLKMREVLAGISFPEQPQFTDQLVHKLNASNGAKDFLQKIGQLKTLWLVLGLIIIGIGSFYLVSSLMMNHHLKQIHEIVADPGDPVAVLEKMSATYDQFNDTYDPEALTDELTIIYIPGSNDPFARIYDKHKGKKITENVQFIGGFKEMMLGWDPKRKKNHLQEAFRSRYGKNHFRILLDLESEMAKLLDIEGYSIIKISKKTNQVIRREDFGFDRLSFFRSLEPYFVD